MKARKMKAPGRRYRVVKRLPWIEGGRPAPGFQWEGGKGVVYEPGDTVYLEDRELASIYHKLEAIDDAGRAALEEARANAEAPAKITFVADLDPSTVEWLARALDEKRRVYGCRVERGGEERGSCAASGEPRRFKASLRNFWRSWPI